MKKLNISQDKIQGLIYSYAVEYYYKILEFIIVIKDIVWINSLEIYQPVMPT